MYKKVYEAKNGKFYDRDHYTTIINKTQIGFKENGDILFYLCKNNIKPENREDYKKVIKPLAKTKTKNRGSASGPVDITKFPKNAGILVNKNNIEYTDEKDRFSVFYRSKDGKFVNRCQSNMVRCGVAGYFDRVAALPCRKVGWSTKNTEKHKVLEKLAKEIEEGHSLLEDSYDFHKKRAEQSEPYLFDGSIYSTMTLNYDFRTACHKDKGDLIGGLSTLTILEDIPNNYEGFYTGLPEYKIAFDLRDGDTLYFDAHEYHANTDYNVLSDKLPIDDLVNNNFAGRMSVVCYLRDRLHLCGD